MGLHVDVFLLSLKVVIILGVGAAALRNGVHRFAFLLPALCLQLSRVLVARKGQIGSDAVPDAVTHRAVALVVCADQLVPIKGADESTEACFTWKTGTCHKS